MKAKIALVTGAGRGIGAATAELLADQGCNVLITSRTQTQLEEVTERIRSRVGAGAVHAFVCDTGDSKQVQALFRECDQVFGTPDILVNNAAILINREFQKLSLDDWDQTFAVNVRGVFLCCKEVFTRWTEKTGTGRSIVNLSSLGGIQSTEKFKGMSAYVASKASIVALTESLAVEGREHGIRVNCVAPGAVDTEMLRQAAPHLKTRTTPRDVANVITYLCDADRSGALSGSVIEIHSNL